MSDHFDVRRSFEELSDQVTSINDVIGQLELADEERSTLEGLLADTHRMIDEDLDAYNAALEEAVATLGIGFDESLAVGDGANDLAMIQKAGLGVAATSFNLDRLAELPERLDNAKYLSWLNRAESIFLKALDRAVQGTQAGSPGPFHLKA